MAVSDKIKSMARQLQGKKEEYDASYITSPASLARALTNYGVHYSSEQMFKWLCAYLKEFRSDVYAYVSKHQYTCTSFSIDVIGKIARLVHYHKVDNVYCNKAILDELIDNHIKHRIRKVISNEPKPKKVDVNELAVLWDITLDKIVESRRKVSFALEGKQKHIDEVIAMARQLYDELMDSEARKYYDKVVRRLLLDFVKGVLKQAETIKTVEQPKRKARKRKPSAIVRGFKILKEHTLDSDIKILSINPEKMLDKTEILTYNISHNKIHLIRALRGTKLSVKGCQILNVDENASFAKRVKQPELLFDSGCQNHQVLKERMEALRSKPTKAHTRTNAKSVMLLSTR